MCRNDCHNIRDNAYTFSYPELCRATRKSAALSLNQCQTGIEAFFS